jgi:YYY domain-containing protein
LIDVFTWWLAVELLGFIALPFTIVLFKKLPDRGYAFGKALSILFIAFFLWLAASAHILPNSRWAIVLIIALMAAGSLFLAIRRRQQITSFISENRRVIIATELIFLFSFVLLAVMRAYNADILFGEKPMDFALLNGTLRSDYFPAHDPWLSGHSVSYYYFGYVMMATLTKFTGVAPGVAFNLSLALIFALTAIGAFSIVYNLVRMRRGGARAAIGFGLVAVALLLLLANLEGVLELFHAHGGGSPGFWEWAGIDSLDKPYNSEHWYPTDHWWWWRATRVIGTMGGGMTLDFTITEFPFFSFLFADLHPHLMALPFVLLSLALSLEIFSSSASLGLAWLKRNWPKLLVFAICLGSLGFINTWDLPTYTLIFIVAALMGAYWARGKMDLKLLRDVGVFALALTGLAIVFYLPYYLSTEGIYSGIGAVGDADTRPFHFFIVWGLLLFIGVSFALAQAWDELKRRFFSWKKVAWAVVLPLLPLAAWAVYVVAKQADFSIVGKFLQVLPFLVILALILYVIIGKAQRSAKPDDDGEKASLFALLLLFAGFLITMGTELFYVDDLFGECCERMNTVFKLYFQTWVLFAIACAFGLYYLWSRWSGTTFLRALAKRSWWGICLLLIACSLIYPIAATITLTDSFGGEPTLNGLAFFERDSPAESEAVGWLNDNVGDAPVIVEAFGGWDVGLFTYYWRISARTGLPTILGSPHHELQWRGSADDFGERIPDINLIYESQDIGQVEGLLEKYDVTYVFVGDLERQQYGAEVGEKFAHFMDVVFENEGVTIYQVRGNGEGGS